MGQARLLMLHRPAVTPKNRPALFPPRPTPTSGGVRPARTRSPSPLLRRRYEVRPVANTLRGAGEDGEGPIVAGNAVDPRLRAARDRIGPGPLPGSTRRSWQLP